MPRGVGRAVGPRTALSRTVLVRTVLVRTVLVRTVVRRTVLPRLVPRRKVPPPLVARRASRRSPGRTNRRDAGGAVTQTRTMTPSRTRLPGLKNQQSNEAEESSNAAPAATPPAAHPAERNATRRPTKPARLHNCGRTNACRPPETGGANAEILPRGQMSPARRCVGQVDPVPAAVELPADAAPRRCLSVPREYRPPVPVWCRASAGRCSPMPVPASARRAVRAGASRPRCADVRWACRAGARRSRVLPLPGGALLRLVQVNGGRGGGPRRPPLGGEGFRLRAPGLPARGLARASIWWG